MIVISTEALSWITKFAGPFEWHFDQSAFLSTFKQFT